MVVVHVKLSSSEGFLFEATCAESNDNLIAQIVSQLQCNGNGNAMQCNDRCNGM